MRISYHRLDGITMGLLALPSGRVVSESPVGDWVIETTSPRREEVGLGENRNTGRSELPSPALTARLSRRESLSDRKTEKNNPKQLHDFRWSAVPATERI